MSREDWVTFDLAWETVHLLCHVTSQFHMGKTLFALALAQLPTPIYDEPRQHARVIALSLTAWYSFMTNQLTQGLELVEEALGLIDNWTIDDPRVRVWAFNTITCLLWARGDFEKALQHCHLLQEVTTQTDVVLYDELTHFDFGVIYLQLGDFNRARAHFKNFEARGTYFERSYANNFLGQIAEILGDLQEAQTLYTRSLDLYRQLKFPWGLATALINLGRVIGRTGSLWEAAACLYEALDVALDIQTPQHIIGAVTEIAFLLPAIGHLHLAVDILEFLYTQPVAWQEYQSRVEQCLLEVRQLGEGQPVPAGQSPQFTTLDDVVELIQASRSWFQLSGT